MKKDIHPKLHTFEARCTCGNAIETNSVLPNISMTICSQCHPFYTGAQRFVDAAGRIDKFKKKYDKKA